MIWYLTGFQEVLVFCDDNKTSTTRGAQEPVQLYFCIDPHSIRVTHFKKISISLETKQISFSLKEEMMAGDHQEKLTRQSVVVTMVYHRCCTKMFQPKQPNHATTEKKYKCPFKQPKKFIFSSETQINPPVVQSLLLLALICRPCPACGLSWGRL